MSTTSRIFGSEATIINAQTLDGTGLSETFSSIVDLETNGYEGTQIITDVTWDGSGSEDIILSFYGSVDGSNFDDIAIFSKILTVDAGNTVQSSIIIKDLIQFKAGVVHSASESTPATVTMKHKPWRWQSV